jgi:Bacterial Ig-like domain
VLLLFKGCANQLPPGGGEEDKTPPKAEYQSPKQNSLNFTGNSIVLEFDEYVDRRSFQEAFHISPPIKGQLDFDWSGKQVEVIFGKPLWKVEPNKTFVVTINSTLTDIRGNALTSPISFAFSTGPQIDKASVSGFVFNKEEKPMTILAYKLGINDTSFNPAKNIADYVSETSSDGSYKLTNLSAGEYRIIAIDDEDRNLLYTSERESYGVLNKDVSLEDSSQLDDINFFVKNIKKVTGPVPNLNISDFYKDSLEFVFSSIENESRTVLPEQSIFFYFNKHRPTREDFVNSFYLKDDAGNPEKVVFNWRNDSLVEIFSPADFMFNKNYEASFKIIYGKDSTYNYILKFRIVSANSFGEIKGVIRNFSENIELPEKIPVRIELHSTEIKPEIQYSFDVKDTVFELKKIFEADYSLFSYVDKNGNSEYNYGSPYPFEYAEPFYVYPKKISVKGGWAIENVVLKFIN